MKLDISVKYLLKSLIPSLIILTVFIWDGKIARKMQECFMRSSDALSVPLLFLFNEDNTEMVIRFTGKEFWQKDFFTNPVGGSLTAIFELFCFVISVPVVAIYLIFIFCKALSGK